MSALTGRSPRAYDFWVSCREPQTARPATAHASANILVVVNCRTTTAHLDRTMRSLGGARAVTIGGPGTGENESVSDLNSALSEADWICAISCGDVLADHALDAYSEAIAAHPTAKIVYADDDLLSEVGKRHDPHFKPDWNPELFEHHDFVTRACVFRTRATNLSEETLADWPRGPIASLLANGTAPVHLPTVLHHRWRRPDPIVPAKPGGLERLPKPSVTIIIPTRNQVDLLKTCLAGVQRTHYPQSEIAILVIDNDSDDPAALSYLDHLRAIGVEVLPSPGPFNYSALNNGAVAKAKGEILVFLNNDIEIIDEDWLSLLVMHAVKKEIGAVGAQLLYPDGTIQHAGVYTGIGGGAGHAHRYLPADAPGYFERARLPQRVSAVTGACLAVSRAKFLAVGGFDEEQFPVAFNDVDLCLKLNAAGWQSFYEPRAQLIHHESKSRGSDRVRANRSRFAGELAALKAKWRTDVEADPFHHPHLSPFCEEFFVAI